MRLKYNDFDTSWNNMKKYYEGMGLGSASSYTGSYSQNVKMLSWMKKNGYSSGGTIGKLIKSSGEDGFVLAKSGEHILNKEQLRIADNMVSKLIDFRKSMPIIKPIQPIEKSAMGDVTMNITLPNVQNGEDFVNFLKTKKAQNIIQSYTTDLAVGKNSLNKYKYK